MAALKGKKGKENITSIFFFFVLHMYTFKCTKNNWIPSILETNLKPCSHENYGKIPTKIMGRSTNNPEKTKINGWRKRN